MKAENRHHAERKRLERERLDRQTTKAANPAHYLHPEAAPVDRDAIFRIARERARKSSAYHPFAHGGFDRGLYERLERRADRKAARLAIRQELIAA